MQAARNYTPMSHLNAGTLYKILTTLLALAASEECDSPAHQKGVHVQLAGKTIIFSAVRFGQTTEVKMFADFYVGSGHFLLSREDVANLHPALNHNMAACVCIAQDSQPITRHPCLRIEIDDWFTSYAGAYRCDGWPKRSSTHRNKPVAIKERGDTITALSALARTSEVSVSSPGNIADIAVLQPIPGLVSVKSYLY